MTLGIDISFKKITLPTQRYFGAIFHQTCLVGVSCTSTCPAKLRLSVSFANRMISLETSSPCSDRMIAVLVALSTLAWYVPIILPPLLVPRTFFLKLLLHTQNSFDIACGTYMWYFCAVISKFLKKTCQKQTCQQLRQPSYKATS